MKGTIIIGGKEIKQEGGKKNERCVDRKMAGSYSGRLSYKPAPETRIMFVLLALGAHKTESGWMFCVFLKISEKVTEA